MSLLLALCIIWRLLLCFCFGAAGDLNCVPRFTIPYPSNLTAFREDNVFNYSTMLIREDLGVVLLGAREAVYALNANNISDIKSAVYWRVTEEKQRECAYKGKHAEVDCRNYIRTLHVVNDTTVYVCGTNAFSPTCDYMTFANGQLTLRGKQEEGKGKCPFDPFQRYSSLMVGNDLYSATSINFLGSEPVILRSSSLPLRTEFKYFWLNEPNFVYTDLVEESRDSAEGDDDKIYFFFSENAVEYDFDRKIQVSRVARVCKGDEGGQRTLQRKWTSFLKARLDCSLPEPSLPLIVQDVFLMKHKDWRKSVFYGIFTPQSGVTQVSAVCAYSVSSLRSIFDHGKFKTRVEVESSQDKWVMYTGDVPIPRPGACINNLARKMGVSESRQLPDKTLQFVRDRPLMDEAVSPLTGSPLLVKYGPLLTRIVVDTVTALDKQQYQVMFTGTENGYVQKAVNYDGEMFIIEEIQVYETPVPVNVLRLSADRAKIYAGSDIGAVQMPVSNCGHYKTCMDCVLSRDPYCAWDSVSAKCSAVHGFSSSIESAIQSLKGADVSKCPQSALPPAADMHLVVGNNVQLLCPLRSNLARSRWRFSEQTLQTSSKYFIYGGGLLLINASEADAGLYTCDSVEQINGQTYSQTVALYRIRPRPKPEPPAAVATTRTPTRAPAPSTTIARTPENVHTLRTETTEMIPDLSVPENMKDGGRVGHLEVAVALLSLLCLLLVGVIFWIWGRGHLKCLKIFQRPSRGEDRRQSADYGHIQNPTAESNHLMPESGNCIANKNHTVVNFQANNGEHRFHPMGNISSLDGLGYIHDESEI